MGDAYAASGAWLALGHASHALCLAGSPMGGSLVACVDYCSRVRQLGVRSVFGQGQGFGLRLKVLCVPKQFETAFS